MFEIIRGNKKEKRKRELQIMSDYRHTFCRDEITMRTFSHMLTELNFFDEYVDSESERIRQDYAKRLLCWLGVFHPGNIQSITEFMLKKIEPKLMSDIESDEE